MNNLIAVTIGDINGIGIDILIKLYKQKKIRKIVLFSNFKIINNYILSKKIKIKLNIVNSNKDKIDFKNNKFNIYTFSSSSNEDNTLKSIRFSHYECLKNNYVGMVTLPIRKDLIIKKILPTFVGHTEFLQGLENKNYSNMILSYKNIIISPLTTHIKLNSIVNKIKKKNYLFNQITNINKTLIRDFNIKKPKIIISGINPHAGENGEIGLEEKNIIIPVINNLKKNKVLVYGPYSADSILIEKNIRYYNCFLFIFHDQALIPYKYISKFRGVNYTGNLKVIRTSPDHGTAYNLKGSNHISTKSLENCFSLIKFIKKNRINYDQTKKISKPKFY